MFLFKKGIHIMENFKRIIAIIAIIIVSAIGFGGPFVLACQVKQKENFHPEIYDEKYAFFANNNESKSVIVYDKETRDMYCVGPTYNFTKISNAGGLQKKHEQNCSQEVFPLDTKNRNFSIYGYLESGLRIVIDRETKIMYLYNNLLDEYWILANADGTPKVFE